MRVRHLALILLLATASATNAAAAPPSRDELKRLEIEKHNIAESIVESRQQLDGLQNDLKAIEMRVAELNLAAQHTQNELAQVSQALEALAEALSQQRETVSEERQRLAHALRAQYGRPPANVALRLLIADDDPATSARHFVYLQYLADARRAHIETMASHIADLGNTQAAVQTQEKNLTRLAGELYAQRTALTSQRDKQREIVARLGSEITSKEEQLREVERNEQALRETLRRLELKARRKEADNSTRSSERGPIAGLRPPLPMPASGAIERRGDRGLLIAAPEGAAVKAVADGQIAFADWLRGYGLMLIIDHGDGLMSLYGYNQTLLKSPGQAVRAGETVASVGNSGGQLSPGLYFELRHQGQPLDPQLWLTGTP